MDILKCPKSTWPKKFWENGFFGFYVGGTHAYKIIDSSSNTLTLKTVGFEGLAWYIILTNEQ